MLVDEPLELEAPAAVKNPSELLVEARQRLGLSQKEVADELYLTTSFIEYIDVGEFASIPKMGSRYSGYFCFWLWIERVFVAVSKSLRGVGK